MLCICNGGGGGAASQAKFVKDFCLNICQIATTGCLKNLCSFPKYLLAAVFHFINMSLQYIVGLLLVPSLLCMTASQVTFVNRNVTDSFRVGEDGCTKNTDCPDSATCQYDSGLCLCSDGRPNFLNFTAISSSITYGCLQSESIRAGVGECS